jgi:putative SOS response-associated peptidase YedK
LKNRVFIVYRCKIASNPHLFVKKNNALVADIHNRMPAILEPVDYHRRLSDEADPRELMRLLSRRADADVANPRTTMHRSSSQSGFQSASSRTAGSG